MRRLAALDVVRFGEQLVGEQEFVDRQIVVAELGHGRNRRLFTNRREPFRDEPSILLFALLGTVLAEIDSPAVDLNQGLTAGFVESILGNAQ
jgi:hypothetical protein